MLLVVSLRLAALIETTDLQLLFEAHVTCSRIKVTGHNLKSFVSGNIFFQIQGITLTFQPSLSAISKATLTSMKIYITCPLIDDPL